jgi:hypothetical protein
MAWHIGQVRGHIIDDAHHLFGGLAEICGVQKGLLGRGQRIGGRGEFGPEHWLNWRLAGGDGMKSPRNPRMQNAERAIANSKPIGNAAIRMDAISVEKVFLCCSMVQSIEATHSPTTTISGPSCGSTGMGA